MNIHKWYHANLNGFRHPPPRDSGNEYFGTFHLETKRKDCYSLGTRKETTLKKEDICVSGNVWEQNNETNFKKWIHPENILKIETKMLFPLSLHPLSGSYVLSLMHLCLRPTSLPLLAWHQLWMLNLEKDMSNQIDGSPLSPIFHTVVTVNLS